MSRNLSGYVISVLLGNKLAMMFFSEIPLLYRRNHIDSDIALVSLTPPDKHGYCSMGSSIDITRSALKKSKYIIGQVKLKPAQGVFGFAIISAGVK